MPDIGERVANIRLMRMWTQARLAREAGVSPTTVSAIETGKIGSPHFGTLGKLALALGVAPEELLDSRKPAEQQGPAPFRWDGLETLGRASSRARWRMLPSKASTPSLADWTLSKSASSDFMEGFPRVASRDAS
jgi:transcriptional regulator with XRE-family HTH domain